MLELPVFNPFALISRAAGYYISDQLLHIPSAYITPMTSTKRRQQIWGQTDPQNGINKHFQPTLGELFPAFKAAANNLSEPYKPNIEFISYCWLLVPNLLSKIILVMVDNS